jgi:hypothetical protein
MQWVIEPKTSSHTAANEACVEAGATADNVGFLDSKFKFRKGETSPVLLFGTQAATKFFTAVKCGEYDLTA